MAWLVLAEDTLIEIVLDTPHLVVNLNTLPLERGDEEPNATLLLHGTLCEGATYLRYFLGGD